MTGSTLRRRAISTHGRLDACWNHTRRLGKSWVFLLYWMGCLGIAPVLPEYASTLSRLRERRSRPAVMQRTERGERSRRRPSAPRCLGSLGPGGIAAPPGHSCVRPFCVSARQSTMTSVTSSLFPFRQLRLTSGKLNVFSVPEASNAKASSPRCRM